MKKKGAPYFYLALAILFIAFSSSCISYDVRSSQDNAIKNNKIDNAAQSNSYKYDGTKYVKDEGWQIPGLDVSDRKKTDIWIVDIGTGKKVDINATDYDPIPADVITEEPTKLLNPNFGLIHIYAIKEFAKDNRKFCYKVQAERAAIDEKTGKHSYAGVLFFFSYYDEDGDGKFETLIFDERNNQGRSDFHLSPHIPQWLLPEK